MTLFCASLSAQFPDECVLAGSSAELNANTLNAITYASDRFVAVGLFGTVVVSTSGGAWRTQPTLTTRHLRGVTFGDGIYVAVGDAGTVLISSDATTWFSSGDIASTNNLNSVSFGNGQFVATSDGGNVFVSSNVFQWIIGNNGNALALRLNGSHFGNGVFVLYGDARVFASSNAVDWAARNLTYSAVYRCGAFGGGKHIVAGPALYGYDQVAVSSNGFDWSTQRRYDLTALTYGDGRFVGVFGSDNGVLITPDTTNWWYSWAGDAVPSRLYGIAFGEGKYIAVGSQGMIVASPNDGTNWNKMSSNFCTFASMAVGPLQQVGVTGNNGVIYSAEDGVHFFRRGEPHGILNAVGYTNGVFVTVGYGIKASTDATNWMDVSISSNGFLRGLTHIGSNWIAIGQTIVSSEDGFNWILRDAPNELMSVVVGDGKAVAVGQQGQIRFSTNGIFWERRDYTAQVNHLGSVSFTDGFFVVYGWYGYLTPESWLISRDGRNWTNAVVSGPLLELRATTNVSERKLWIAGVPNRRYTAQLSTNLPWFTSLTTISNGTGVSSIVVSNNGLPATFFRAVAD